MGWADLAFSIVDLSIFYLMWLKKSSTLQHTDLTWVGRHIVRPSTVPNLGMADREFELWTWSDMGSSDLEFGLETGPVRGLEDPEWAYFSSL